MDEYFKVNQIGVDCICYEIDPYIESNGESYCNAVENITFNRHSFQGAVLVSADDIKKIIECLKKHPRTEPAKSLIAKLQNDLNAI